MNNARKLKILKTERGVSLLITFFIMIIILSIVLSVSALLYSEIKIIRNIGDSVVGFYAADSGIEKVLYYDWQVLPVLKSGKSAARGLCAMISGQPFAYPDDYNPSTPIENTTNACQPKSVTDPTKDSSVYCNNTTGYPKIYSGLSYVSPVGETTGCDPSICNDCQIYFETDFSDGMKYSTTAEVYPDPGDGTKSDMQIESNGTFNGASRYIQVLLAP